LIPSVMLRDIGGAMVPAQMQKAVSRETAGEALDSHVKESVMLVGKIIIARRYDKKDIDEICRIIGYYKLKNFRGANKIILIDAENLSDIFNNIFTLTQKITARRRAKFLISGRVINSILRPRKKYPLTNWPNAGLKSGSDLAR